MNLKDILVVYGERGQEAKLDEFAKRFSHENRTIIEIDGTKTNNAAILLKNNDKILIVDKSGFLSVDIWFFKHTGYPCKVEFLQITPAWTVNLKKTK